ncbi:hypothetical protein ACUNV4_20410 [Granulosicoccus sp. 3-233]|uniref:hypothetical protein n=1 Tax=Granulosicoccus sp. 3-233 TaxID=3417969 RepID=UPI003D335ED3
MQVMDRIILRLIEPQKNREDAVLLGRLGFLEWLVSIPDDCDFDEELRLAHERAEPLKLSMPAVGVLCELLSEAGKLAESPTPASTSLVRRKGARRRRSLH